MIEIFSILFIGGIYILAFFLLKVSNNSDSFPVPSEIKKDNNGMSLEKSQKQNLKELLNIKEKKVFLGMAQKQKIELETSARHIFVCGTTGSGKTVTLSNFIKSVIDYDYPSLIVDGKGDIGEGSLLEITKKLAEDKKKVYVINFTDTSKSDFYNPFKNASATIVKDMLINMTNWSEEHYKLNTERYLQRLTNLLELAKIPLSLKSIVENMEMDKFLLLSTTLSKNNKITKEQHLANVNLAKNSEKIIAGAIARFSTIIESQLGQVFDENGVDIYDVLQENAVIIFILNPLLYAELSPLLGALIIIDSKKAVSKLFTESIERSFFIFDEINVYANKQFLDLVNKSRSANVTCILSCQSLSDLEENVSENFKEQIIENCNNYIVMRQNSAKNAEQWSNIIGTHNTMDITYQLKENDATGLGSAKHTRTFYFHPDVIKSLKKGEAIFVSKDYNVKKKFNVNKPF